MAADAERRIPSHTAHPGREDKPFGNHSWEYDPAYHQTHREQMTTRAS
ncbi:hypothetical protein CNECB9_2110006 [Cupriavidus necator]|uniref:Uncharacterized protein n=1 Tax=Cupriavidus necator TaxID=106590 RepID=A0A1K0IPW9_CUPNE|nr:hypothetical protein CNECB9_2110006 [Cupriavidus necator]